MHIQFFCLLIASIVFRTEATPSVSDLLRNKRASDDILKSVSQKIIINKDNLPGFSDGNNNTCMNKIIIVKETQYTRGIQCKHVLKEKCHLTYITDYHPSPQKNCETNYKKKCQIVFKEKPYSEKVRKCYKPLTKNCTGTTGPEVCKIVTEDHCETKYERYNLTQDMPNCEMKETTQCLNKTIQLLNIPQDDDEDEDAVDDEPKVAVKEICETWPIQTCEMKSETIEKVHPKTKCEKIPQNFCAPDNCKTLEGEEVCHEEMKTVVQKMPEEECDLQPQENCQTESVLVPKLIPKKNCVKVPKEVCYNTKSDPRETAKPINKTWCYNSDELIADAASPVLTSGGTN